jgi:hypothetical protein
MVEGNTDSDALEWPPNPGIEMIHSSRKKFSSELSKWPRFA